MSKKKRLLWQIFPPMVVVTMAAVIGATFYASKIIRQFYLEQKTADLRVRAQLVIDGIHDDFAAGNRRLLARRSRALAARSRARITLIMADGEVIADSDKDPVRMDNHADRREIVAAMTSGYGATLRFSRTLGKNMLYVALPVYSTADNSLSSPVLGVVRLSIPLVSVDKILNMIYRQNFQAAFLLLILAAVITLFVSRKISRPLEEMGRAARRYGELDFSRRIVLPEKAVISREVAGLAATINSMAMELRRRINIVTKQKNELEAVFKSMVEGVLVVDIEGRLVRANDTALALFNLPGNSLPGHSLTQVFRDADLSRFIREILAGGRFAEQDIVLRQVGGERHFHASGAPFHDGAGNRTGALVVLNDITRIKKLENMRREFVANVSHELKTPITSVTGFVETLLDGALESKDEARRFLEIIHRQANRLNAIVDDLLRLSRIEQEEEQRTIELRRQALRPVLESCIEMCTMKAGEKGIALMLDCRSDIVAAINRSLLEQAVINLLVNAIKYSPEKSEVRIKVWRLDHEIRIDVVDEGCGIAANHLSRLFERFYRSDKARSRKLGGTGLGLAIVKHIVQVHGGQVKVKSKTGHGSTFTIMLPAAGPA